MFGIRWEAANGKPGYADLCIKLMDAAYSIVPNALFLVEGTAQSGLSYNWGELLSHYIRVQLCWAQDATQLLLATNSEFSSSLIET